MLRFAPSPTRDMHIGDLRVAIINYLISKQRNEAFLLRIEDTDKEDNIEGKDTEILQILEKFAIKHDSVFHQSEHLNIHQRLAIRLLEEKKAFLCICTPVQLEADREDARKNGVPYNYYGRCIDAPYDVETLKEEKTPFVIRLHQPEEAITYHDLIKGDIRTTPNDIGSFVILKEDGTPTQTFASACDDMLGNIDFVICEDEHLSQTAKQIHLKKQLGYEEKTGYAHLPPLLNEKGKKMGKDDAGYSLQWLFEEGYIPDAILNYLLLLGNHQAPQKIFTLPEAVVWFKLEDLSKSAVAFDLEKLRFLNREHLKKMDDKVLSTLFGFADTDIGKLAKLYLKEASTIKELESKIRPIFSPKNFNADWAKEMRILEKHIWELPMINSYDDFKSTLIKESGLKEENLLKPLRLLLTGAPSGPELSEIYPLIKPYLLEVAS